jgi:hypothetical protein
VAESYRQEDGDVGNKERQEWRKWVNTHRGRLEQIGLPLSVYYDRGNWWHFLSHGYVSAYDDCPGFTYRELTLAKKEDLLQFVTEVAPDSDVAHILEVQLQRIALGDDPDVDKSRPSPGPKRRKK